MRKEHTKVITECFCDVCNSEIVESDGGWYEYLSIGGSIIAEYYPPQGIDLCRNCQRVFTKVSSKWKQERYEAKELSERERLKFIFDIKMLTEEELQ